MENGLLIVSGVNQTSVNWLEIVSS